MNLLILSPLIQMIRAFAHGKIIMMLDRILEYFQHYEPSHPAPIFIRRTKEMIGMDFIPLLKKFCLKL